MGCWPMAMDGGYGPLVAAIISIHYLGTRHRASARQLNVMSQIMAIFLILSFAFVWCVVFTIQTLTFSTWARPWLLDGVVVSHGPFIWQEGFPASAPAIAMMVGTCSGLTSSAARNWRWWFTWPAAAY